jgi:hypothetical protein
LLIRASSLEFRSSFDARGEKIILAITAPKKVVSKATAMLGQIVLGS